jgi:hypothetical protein
VAISRFHTCERCGANRGGGPGDGAHCGYVQSGKTMSFETVAALARDNAYQVVIVVAGTSNPLFEQSTCLPLGS